ncbi:MAG: AarF/ABC1/UbiB kinase family protein, partial [Pseudomonadota bacterium]
IARALKEALGRSKGPLMKIAQMVSTIPDFLPEDYAEELASLQAHAPSMGWNFVQRRMRAELGDEWGGKFAAFGREAAHAASLGQVHKAKLHDGRLVACKLQYPEMASAVENDLSQLRTLMGLYKRLDKALDPEELVEEIGDRLREELDYRREAQHMALYRAILADQPQVAIPEPILDLSTDRLLTMTWLDGVGVSHYETADQDTRNRIATMLFHTWWIPFTRNAVIHGDPHLGNYALADEATQLNLLDFGCIRIFPPSFVDGVVALYRGLEADDFDATAAAYEQWGFRDLTRDLIETLNIWARFIYGPLLDDRVRTVADGVAVGSYGRKEAFEVRQRLKEQGPVRIPREFVFMDRAAIGLGSAYLRLGAQLNFYRLFNQSLEGFDHIALAVRQDAALEAVGLKDAA